MKGEKMEARLGFLEELNKLRHDVLAMATKVEEDLGKAIAAVHNSDVELANDVIEGDLIVNAMQLKIEDETAIVIATQQPVARDLREMVTILKIISNLERVGDHAVHFAKAVIKFHSEPPFRSSESLEKMAETGREMIRDSISAYLNQDAEAARKAAALDDKIDAEHKTLTEEILSQMKKHPELIKKAAKLLNLSNQLERLGDHVTNICECVIYMTEGKHEELNE